MRLKPYLNYIIIFLATVLFQVIIDDLEFFYCYNTYLISLLFGLFLLGVNTTLKINLKELRKKIWPLITCIVFLFFIYLEVIQTGTQLFDLSLDPEKRLNEKRVLAGKPEFNSKDPGKFLPDLSAYFNDHFNLREWLVYTNNLAKPKVFETSPVDFVHIGKDGWLFYDVMGQVNGLEGRHFYNDLQLQHIKNNLLHYRDWLKKRNCKYYLVVLPDKHTIYPEHLPITIIPTKGENRTDKLMRFLKEETDLKILDTRSALLKAKGDRLLYQKTDTHWNLDGAFIGYGEIMNFMAQDDSRIKPYTANDFDVKDDMFDRGGDLATAIGQRHAFTTHFPRYYPKPHLPVAKQTLIEEYQTIYADEAKNTRTFELSNANLPKMVAFHDSFTGYLYEFLSAHFQRSTFISSYVFRKDIIEKEQPDIVVHFILERAMADMASSPDYVPLP